MDGGGVKFLLGSFLIATCFVEIMHMILFRLYSFQAKKLQIRVSRTSIRFFYLCVHNKLIPTNQKTEFFRLDQYLKR